MLQCLKVVEWFLILEILLEIQMQLPYNFVILIECLNEVQCIVQQTGICVLLESHTTWRRVLYSCILESTIYKMLKRGFHDELNFHVSNKIVWNTWRQKCLMWIRSLEMA